MIKELRRQRPSHPLPIPFACAPIAMESTNIQSSAQKFELSHCHATQASHPMSLLRLFGTLKSLLGGVGLIVRSPLPLLLQTRERARALNTNQKAAGSISIVLANVLIYG